MRNVASLINTGGTLGHTVTGSNGSTGTVDLSNAEANVSGGGDTVHSGAAPGTPQPSPGRITRTLFNQSAFGLDTMNTAPRTPRTRWPSASPTRACSPSLNPGANTLITLDANDVVTLTNVQASSLGAITIHT